MTEKLHTAAAWLTANGKNRALRWLVVLGVAGILLIALSEWLPGRSRAQADAASPAAVPVEASAVEAALEKRITAMLDGVQGVGSCRVMVTLEQGVQQVYAAEQSHSSGTQADSSAEKTITVETASVRSACRSRSCSPRSGEWPWYATAAMIRRWLSG